MISLDIAYKSITHASQLWTDVFIIKRNKLLKIIEHAFEKSSSTLIVENSVSCLDLFYQRGGGSLPPKALFFLWDEQQ